MKKILQALSAVPAPSGSETEIRRALLSYLPGALCRTDPHGSLLVHREGKGSSTMIVTAMDTPCLYITYTADGFARFSAAGSLTLADGSIVRLSGGAYGVIGSDADGQFIDCGTFRPVTGAYAVPVPSFYPIGDTMAAGFAMGQYAAMTAVLAAAMAETENDVWFVFGAKYQIRQFSPAFMRDLAIARLISVDVSAANDAPAEKTVFLSLGGGTALRVKDASMLSCPDLTAEAEKLPYPTQREVSTRRGIGGTLQKAFGGVRAVGFGIPTRYADTLHETVAFADIKNTAELLSAMLKTNCQ